MSAPSAEAGELPIITIGLTAEHDLVVVRQRARTIAEMLDFNRVDQTRIATAVSEIARKVLRVSGGGRVRYLIRSEPHPRLAIVIQSNIQKPAGQAPAPRHPPEESWNGDAGVDLPRQLMDRLDVVERPNGDTTVDLEKLLPPSSRTIGTAGVAALTESLARRTPESLLEELHQQQQELLQLLADLNSRQEALEALNTELQQTNQGVLALYNQVTQELDDTNRGVLALYAQLDDQAHELQRLNALKNQFLSHLSHEFRTPLNSTLALSRLLIAEADGPLNQEQQNQLRFIHHGATELLGMVNDLLDLAKIEAGHLQVRPETFTVEDLFSTLRGLFRPLVGDTAVRLVFTDLPDLPTLHTDQTKVGQILRNLISNALKFTMAGEVTVTAHAPDWQHIELEVRDTGIGIGPEALDSIFQEYVQVEGPLQRRSAGTGLGLPLSAKLAALLGGSIHVESAVGVGSVFTLRLPAVVDTTGAGARAAGTRDPDVDVKRGPPSISAASSPLPARGTPFENADNPVVLLINDDPASRYLVEHRLAPIGCTIVHTRSGREGLRAAAETSPNAIILDLGLPDISGLDVLARIKNSDLEDVPIVVYTSRQLSEEEHRYLSGLAVQILKKDDPALEEALDRLGFAIVRASAHFNPRNESV